MLFLDSSRLIEYMPKVIWPAFIATGQMLFFSLLIGLFFGFIIAVILVLTGPRGIVENRPVYKILNFLVNFIRSFPLLILIVAIAPLTRFILGMSFGVGAAVVPLSIAVSALIARLFESAFREVDPQVVLAARSFGATPLQIVFQVLLVEAWPSIVSHSTFASIQLLANTTVAGAVGAGGLGAVALTYGDQRFDYPLLYTIVFFFSCLVMFMQWLGDYFYRKLSEPYIGKVNKGNIYE